MPLLPIATNNWQATPNDYTLLVDSLTQHLSRARVTTGILYDRVLPLAMLPSFGQGTQPDTATVGYLRQAYLELRNAAYSPGAAFPLTQAQLREKGRRFLSRDSVALAVLDYQLNYLDTLAVDDNRLLEANRLYYEVASAPRSPYLTGFVTVAAAMADTIRASTSFYVPAELLLGNRTRRVSSLLVDFGNGAGPVACGPGQRRAVQYPNGGSKVLTYTISFTDGSKKICRSSLYVRPYVASRPTLSLPLPLENITAQESFAGYDGSAALFGAGEVRVVLHNTQSQQEYTNSGGATYKLRKPLIILDGFDPQDGSGLSNISIETGFYKLLERAGILLAADQLQRDVVLLNFPNSPRRRLNGTMTTDNVDGGTDYVERNALVLVALLNQLKPRLASASEKFAIIGPSMGGLVSRYALAYMEKRQYALTSTGQPANPQWDHNTALWVSLDVPHQGANIPIGLQEFLRFFQYHEEDAKDKFETRLNTTAAKQLLVHHHTAGAYSVLGAPGYRDRFMLALRNNGRPGSFGYPEQLRRVAISNGRLDGGLQVGSSCGTALQLEKRKDVFKFGTIRHLWFYRNARPGTVALGDIDFAPSNATCYVFKGQIGSDVKLLTWTWHGPNKRFTTAQGTTTSYDLAPGGWYDTQQQIAATGSRNTTFKNVVPNSCFIPTVSALGFQYRSMSGYQTSASLPNPGTVLLGRNLRCNDEIPFDTYFGASTNIRHVEGKDKPTSDFLVGELAGLTEKPVFALAPTSLCPGARATFSVADCPRPGQPNTTYAWLPVGPGLRIVSGQNTPAVLVEATPGYTGTTTLQVVATRNGYTSSLPLRATVSVGSGYVGLQASSGYNSVCISTTVTVQATVFGNVSVASWRVDNGELLYVSGDEATVQVSSAPGVTTVHADYLTNCSGSGGSGSTASASIDVADNLNGFYCAQVRVGNPSAAVFPNPADAYVNIHSPFAAAQPFRIELYNDRGRLVHGLTTRESAVQVDTRLFPAGLYRMQLRQGNNTFNYNLNIQH
ncbi:T9SS type A sorting domain-containing protein [Hymenobacter sp. IS2118]|uniref:T9SS type A sorting domain-containing protein n=1 Tax=Hymenobacter sp. IS2118 TaxID=1505605 RepID=UPI00054DD84D|nr:T9SS type A sorting domain-containing protein [Hymenobacter sp. IS2118]